MLKISVILKVTEALLLNKSNFIALFLIIILVGLLYRSSFSAYFFQDDWFSLRISKVETLTDFIKFFIPRSDVIYYRPLGMQIPYFILNNFFGLDSFIFHMTAYFTHSINIILVYLLVKKLLNKDDLSLLAAYLYGISSLHFIPFYWFATFSFVLGPTFFLLSFLGFIIFLENKKKYYYILSFLFYVLGLVTNEIVFILPLILFFYLLLIRQEKKFILRLIPFITLACLILFFRFKFYPPTITESYQWQINKEILTNLKGYLIWSLNWPEEMKAQLVNFYTFNSRFVREFYSFFIIFIITGFVNFIFLFLLPIFTAVKKKDFAPLLFGFCWFLTALLPVLFFTKHSFSYYLAIPILGLLFSSLKYFQEFFQNKSRQVYLFFCYVILINNLIKDICLKQI